MAPDIANQESKHTVVVRLLNGILRGCEFTLAEGNTVFVVAREEDIERHHQGNVLPDNMIFIPSKQEGLNFEIIIEHDENSLPILRELNDEESNERQIQTDQIVTVGDIRLAIRQSSEVFSDHVLNYEPEKEIIDESPLVTSKKNNKFFYGGLALILFLGVCFAGFFYYTAEQRQVSEISNLLNYNVDDYQIVYGRDNTIYVLAKNETAAEWARQTLIRSPINRVVHILTLSQQKAFIATLINDRFPELKFHRINLDSPKTLGIELSAERASLTEQQKEHISNVLYNDILYITEVQFGQIKDVTVSELAEQGLKQISLNYTRVNNSQGVTFIIEGAFDDGELERLKDFVNRYYQIWGEQYISFAVDLKNDWLKGKSFKYGDRGYVKMSPSHWYFPAPL